MGSLEKRVAEATGGAERGEEPERAKPHSATGGAQAGSQRAWRSLWRRLIGG